MNLQPQAEAEGERRTRSKLEPHREAIIVLRRKHWSYGQIAEWLNERGVFITLSSVHRFCQRAIARRPRSSSLLSIEESAAESFPIQTPSTTTKSTNQHRFNLDI